jgi:hypothetical protein
MRTGRGACTSFSWNNGISRGRRQVTRWFILWQVGVAGIAQRNFIQNFFTNAVLSTTLAVTKACTKYHLHFYKHLILGEDLKHDNSTYYNSEAAFYHMCCLHLRVQKNEFAMCVAKHVTQIFNFTACASFRTSRLQDIYTYNIYIYKERERERERRKDKEREGENRGGKTTT